MTTSFTICTRYLDHRGRPIRREMFQRCLLLVLAFLFLPAIALADVRLQVPNSHPPSPSSLGNWEKYSVQVAYETDRPIVVHADAYQGDKRITSITGGSPSRQAGRGETVLWLSFTNRARVDRIVVWAQGQQIWQWTSIAEVSIPVDLTWTGVQGSTPQSEPEWLTRVNAEQERRAKEQGDPLDALLDSGPFLWIGTALMAGLVLSIPAYFIVQVVAIRRLHGRRRKTAVLTAVPMALVIAYTIIAMLAGSNLFPVVLMFASPPALLYLLVLLWDERSSPVTD